MLLLGSPRVFNCDARHYSDSCPRHCKGGYVTLVSGELVSDPNYCQVDIGDDKFVYISAKWSRQRKLVQDKRKSSTVIGRNMNTFKKKQVVKVLPVKFPCVVKGCSHGYFKDDGKFLDHVIGDHSSIGEVSKAAPLSIQEPLQSESSPSEWSPSFSSECIPVAPNIESSSFCCQNNVALAVDVNDTSHCICVPDSRADPGRYNAFAPTTVHNDCRPKSYLVTLSHYFLLVLCLLFIYIVYVLLLLLAGDIESNHGPSENKREASGEPTGEPPQNKKRKSDKVDSEEEIYFTVTGPGVQPLTKIGLEGMIMLSGGVTKKRGRKPKVKKAFSEKKGTFMPLAYLENKCCEKESIAKITVKEIKSDLPKKDNTQTGFYYQNSRNVTILFIVNNSIEIQSVYLNNLIQRGFPVVLDIPTICLLEKRLLDELVAKSGQPIQFTMVKTGIEDQSPEDLLRPWKYKNSVNVIITYLLNKTTHHINLNKLLNRGFLYPEKRFKYYSFLQFNHFVKTSCLDKKFSEVIQDGTFFMEILTQVNNY